MDSHNNYDRVHFECPLCKSRSSYTVYEAFQDDLDFTIAEAPLEAILEIRQGSKKGRFQCLACGTFLLLEVEYTAEIVPLKTNEDDIIGKPYDEKEVKEAFETIKKAMIDDKPSEPGSYAHSWHCNIAMCVYDSLDKYAKKHNIGELNSTKHNIGNNAASRFMKLCFDVITKA